MKPTTKFSPPSLVDSVSQVLVIAYKEVTDLLETTLTGEIGNCKVLRQESRPEYQDFSPSYLCLLNHKRAWEMAVLQSEPTLIVEADFVPVVGLGQLPLPFNKEQKNVGIAWLYMCASQLYSVSPEGYAEGFSTSAVAYIVTPEAAKHLIELEEKVRTEIGTNCYSSWDSTIDTFLRGKNLRNYIPLRNYGEHGGRPNLEHSLNGLSKTHRADVLYNQLAFMPMYASIPQENYLTFFLVRLIRSY